MLVGPSGGSGHCMYDDTHTGRLPGAAAVICSSNDSFLLQSEQRNSNIHSAPLRQPANKRAQRRRDTGGEDKDMKEGTPKENLPKDSPLSVSHMEDFSFCLCRGARRSEGPSVCRWTAAAHTQPSFVLKGVLICF